MGCVTSKQAVSVTPALDHSGVIRDNAVFGSGRSRGSGLGEMEKKKRNESGLSGSELGESGRASSNGHGGESVSFRLGNLQKYVEGEQVAAGWPVWLSAVAAEAIHGWVPLSADSFEKLEKVYSLLFLYLYERVCLCVWFYKCHYKFSMLKRMTVSEKLLYLKGLFVLFCKLRIVSRIMSSLSNLQTFCCSSFCIESDTSLANLEN